MFAHQNIMFTSPKDLKSMESYLTNENKIFRVAGRKDSQGIITNITHEQDINLQVASKLPNRLRCRH